MADIHPAHELLREIADAETVRLVDLAVTRHRAIWQGDPEHEDVYGLVSTAGDNFALGRTRALVVVYVDDQDFEVDEDGLRDRAESHSCDDEIVEEATSPNYAGAFTVTERCAVCSRVLRTYTDSVL